MIVIGRILPFWGGDRFLLLFYTVDLTHAEFCNLRSFPSYLKSLNAIEIATFGSTVKLQQPVLVLSTVSLFRYQNDDSPLLLTRHTD